MAIRRAHRKPPATPRFALALGAAAVAVAAIYVGCGAKVDDSQSKTDGRAANTSPEKGTPKRVLAAASVQPLPAAAARDADDGSSVVQDAVVSGASAEYVKPPEVDAPVVRNLMKNGSFEGTSKYWVEESEYEIVRGGAVHGEHYLSFGEKIGFRSGSIRIEPGSTVTVSIYARSDTPSEFSVTLVPSNREVAQQTGTVWCKDPKFGGGETTTAEWQRFQWTYRIPALEGNGAFLGASSGWWNKTSYVIMLNGKGPLSVDALSVVAGEGAGIYAPYSNVEVTASSAAVSRKRYPKDACLLRQDEKVDVVAHAFNPAKTPRDVTLRWELLNYDGTLRFGLPVDEQVRIDGLKTIKMSKPITLTGRGLMLARVSVLNAAGEVLGSSDEPFTALAFPKKATKPDMRERFGGSLRGGPLVKAAQQIGLGWTRWFPHFNWTEIQKSGPNEWNWPDVTTKECHDHGISVTAVIYGRPQWAEGKHSHLPKDMEDWGESDSRWDDLSKNTSWDRFVKALVKHYGHDGIVYEFANEPEIGGHKWPADVYYNMARRTYKLIKGVDPRANMQLNVTWPGIYGWTEDFIRRGGVNAFDVHTFHNYTSWHLTDSDTIRTMRNYFKAFGGGHKEIWFNEGWTYIPTSVDYPAPPLTDRTTPDVAHIIVRTVVDLFSAEMEKLITFHIGYGQHGKSWWDWVGSGTEWWDDHGNPTVAVGAYNVLAHNLGLSKHVGTIEPRDAVIHVFQDERNNRGVAITWSMDGASLELPMTGLVVMDVMGNARALDSAMGKTLIELAKGGKPVYLLSGTRMSGAAIHDALKPLHVEVVSSEDTWTPPKLFAGPKIDSADGNPILVDGKPLWGLDQIWPDDPMNVANYKPLVWNGKEWVAKEHGHGGQPAALLKDGNAQIVCRSAWGGNPGNKLAAVSFYAPREGRYEVSADAVHLGMWDGQPPAWLRVIRLLPNGSASEVTSIELTKRSQDNPMKSFTVDLGEGDRLVLVGVFRGMHTASSFVLKNFVIRIAK